MNKSSPDEYAEYLKERHSSYVDQRKRLDSSALSVAEKYDQWILTISGGALAVSLTFLERIADNPAPWTLVFIILAWVCFVTALLVGFLAIHFSAKGLVRQIEILDLEYGQFRATTTRKLPQGEERRSRKNPFTTYIRRSSQISLAALISGSIFLCIFAATNICSIKKEDKPQKIELVSPRNQLQPDGMSDEVPIKGSYIPPRNEAPQPPPPPPPDRGPLIETYIPPANEIPPPPPPPPATNE